ncbi:hypothetical protein ACWX0K_20505 [Nitrobacteraceae bacterium UC4446_H13]
MKLPPAERQAAVDGALEAVREESARIIAQGKRVQADPRSIEDYLTYRKGRLICAPVVKHSDRATTIELSRDGGAGRHTFINPLKLRIQPESTDRFLLILIPRPLATWVKEKQEVNLFAQPPELDSAGDWTADDHKTWDGLRHWSATINTRIDIAKLRATRRPIMTRSQAA